MPSDAQVAAYNAATDRIRVQARQDLRAIFNRLDPTKPYTVKAALMESMPALIEKHGDLMAEVAAEFFEDLVKGAAYIPDLNPPKAYWASTRNALTPLFETGDMNGTATAMAASVDRHVMQAARDVVYQSSRRTSGVAYARMLRGDKNCAFCTVMAGRGAVYSSKEQSGDLGSQFNSYHDFCDCTVIPIRGPNDWPKGYNHRKVEKMYEDAQKESNSDSLKGGKSLFVKDKDGNWVSTKVTRPAVKDGDILQAMRTKYGLK